jgi:GTPase SAR1 family protein
MKVRSSYLRGSSGYLLVADGTRAETLDIAQQLNQRIQQELGSLPFILLVNKSDLQDSWQIDRDQLQQLRGQGWQVIETSALNNDNVEAAFSELSHKMLTD